jgi:hypothetical protein
MLANPKLAMKSRNLSCLLQKRTITYFARENSGLCKREDEEFHTKICNVPINPRHWSKTFAKFGKML